jgi:hypothetical protein
MIGLSRFRCLAHRRRLVVASESALAFAPKDKPGKAMKDAGARQEAEEHLRVGLGLHDQEERQAKIHEHGKFSSSVDVQNGKIAGVSVKHLDRGDVPVTKYKTTKQMGGVPAGGVYFASPRRPDSYLGPPDAMHSSTTTTKRSSYWFPHDMILDGDTGDRVLPGVLRVPVRIGAARRLRARRKRLRDCWGRSTCHYTLSAPLAIEDAAFLRSVDNFGSVMVPERDGAALEDGDGVFLAMLADIRAAKRTVNPRPTSTRGEEAGCSPMHWPRPPRRGVQVCPMPDAQGSRPATSARSSKRRA